jgi:hypothetical protein
VGGLERIRSDPNYETVYNLLRPSVNSSTDPFGTIFQRRRNTLLRVFGIVLLLCHSSVADFIQPFRVSSVGVSLAGPAVRRDVRDGRITWQDNFPISGATFSISSAADSTFGTLRASSSAVLTDPVTSIAVGTDAIAASMEIMQIDFAPFTGQPRFLQVRYTVDGVVSRSGSLNSRGMVLAHVMRADGTITGQGSVFDESVVGLFTFPSFFRFTYGSPFNLYFQIAVDVGTFDLLKMGNFNYGSSEPFPVVQDCHSRKFRSR